VNDSPRLLTAYRILAYITGVGLLTLTIACIAQFGFGVKDAAIVAGVVGFIHGWAYIAYVICAFMVGNKLGWPLQKMAFVILAGTIPTCSFIAERKVMRAIAEQEAAAAAPQLAQV
jgi:integral membrane protein